MQILIGDVNATKGSNDIIRKINIDVFEYPRTEESLMRRLYHFSETVSYTHLTLPTNREV